jgi:hypothetical protein
MSSSSLYTIAENAPDFHFVILENNSNNQAKIVTQYNSQNKRLKSVGYTDNILDMNCLAGQTLEIINSGVYFSPDFPDFLLPKENPIYRSSPQVSDNVITWGVVRSEPGTVSGPPFRGTREVMPRHREYIAIIGNNESKYIVGAERSQFEQYGGVLSYLKADAQLFDHLVQYNIWTKSNWEAERLTEWFQRYMLNYRGMFMEMGIVNMYFDRRVRDDTLMQMKNGYHLRSVLYYVRTEKVTFKELLPIKRIDLKINVRDLGALVRRNKSQDFEPESRIQDKIIQNWINKNQLGGING